jgi:acetyl esterase/lipase
VWLELYPLLQITKNELQITKPKTQTPYNQAMNPKFIRLTQISLISLVGIAAAAGAFAVVRFPSQSLNALTFTGGLTLERDIAYGPEERHRLDLYGPKRLERPVILPPLVLFVHGGVWQFGAKEEYKFLGEVLARAGILTAVINYRLFPQVSYPVYVEDTALAMQWAVSRAEALGADPQRIFLMGHSAGAFNVVDAMVSLERNPLLGLHAGQFAGVIGLAGPYDFDPAKTNPPELFAGYTPEQIMPVHKIKAGLPPFLLLHAELDDIIKPQEGESLKLALERHNIPVQLLHVPKVNHANLMGSVSSFAAFLAPSVKPTIIQFILDSVLQV